MRADFIREISGICGKPTVAPSLPFLPQISELRAALNCPAHVEILEDIQPEFLEVIGAREHNLKNISINIPRNQLVVITSLSGSGKSSLAFDTIYAEGQRRYIESFSAYARQFWAALIGQTWTRYSA